ncbi:MAG: hypothetical protein ABFD46_12695 [Armatimonadota bacterium]
MPVLSKRIPQDIDNVTSAHSTDILLLYTGLIWTFVVTLFRGFRTPNDWAEAHWLVSYQFGLVKRGLPGTLIKPILLLNNSQSFAEHTVLTISTLLLVTFCIVLFGICFSIIREQRYSIESVLVSFIFLSSPFVVISAHLNGYYDNILFLISIWSIVAIRRNRLWLASVLLSLGILVHESIILAGIPSAILALIICSKSKTTQDKKPLWRHTLQFMLPVCVFIVLSIYASFFTDTNALCASLYNYISQYSFIEYQRNIMVPACITSSFTTYLQSEWPCFLPSLSNPVFIMANIPGLAVIILYTIRIMRKMKLSFIPYALIVPLLPLLLHAIAWDTSRIWTYPLIAALFTLWIVHSAPGAARSRLPVNILFVVFGIAVAIWQLNTRVQLMDDMYDPFTSFERTLLYAPAAAIIACSMFRIHRSPDRLKYQG